MNTLPKSAEQLLKRIIDNVDKNSDEVIVENLQKEFDNLSYSDDVRLRNDYKILRENNMIIIPGWASNVPMDIILTDEGKSYFKDKRKDKATSIIKAISQHL